MLSSVIISLVRSEDELLLLLLLLLEFSLVDLLFLVWLFSCFLVDEPSTFLHKSRAGIATQSEQRIQVQDKT
jgi:hypothetical protein